MSCTPHSSSVSSFPPASARRTKRPERPGWIPRTWARGPVNKKRQDGDDENDVGDDHDDDDDDDDDDADNGDKTAIMMSLGL